MFPFGASLCDHCGLSVSFPPCLQMVFGNCGVLQEMSANKGFVEMTGIDAETSQDIAEVIRRHS